MWNERQMWTTFQCLSVIIKVGMTGTKPESNTQILLQPLYDQFHKSGHRQNGFEPSLVER